MNKFWVSWLQYDMSHKVCHMAAYDCCLSLEEAMKTVERVKDDKDTVCAWVDEYVDDKKVGIPFFEVYVNALGYRIRRSHDG